MMSYKVQLALLLALGIVLLMAAEADAIKKFFRGGYGYGGYGYRRPYYGGYGGGYGYRRPYYGGYGYGGGYRGGYGYGGGYGYYG